MPNSLKNAAHCQFDSPRYDTTHAKSHMKKSHTDRSDVTGMNDFGEIPLVGSPKATLTNGESAIPQQFFVYQRNRDIVENIISLIEFDTHYPLFLSEESGHLLLQVGIIGQENYPPNQKARPRKIVYGRKWFIEPTQPTSEIIQTAFLAFVKAREHELREFFTLTYDVNGHTKKATPFNSHMDLPLMSTNSELFKHSDQDWKNIEASVNQILNRIHLANAQFDIIFIKPVDEKQLVIKLHVSSHQNSPLAHFFPELADTELSFLTATHDNAFLFSLMDALLKKSHEYVEENFMFNGFARFSRQQNIKAIGQFSLKTRLLLEHEDEKKQHAFKQLFREMTEQVDSARAPDMACHLSLKQKQYVSLENDIPLEGYLPR